MPNYSFGREVANISLRVVAVVLTFIIILGLSTAWVEDKSISDGFCNIAVLPIDGVVAPFPINDPTELMTTPAFVRDYLATVREDPYIEAILVEINSPGGTPVAAETIAEELSESTLPVIGLVGDMAASGGYLIAAATNHLIASPMSYVGSIGVTMSYLDQTKQNEDEGLTFVNLSAGALKEAGNPNKPLTAEERARFERDLSLVHESFIEYVAKYRNLPVEEVRAFADGGGYTGKDALERKLVDELGGRNTARTHLASVLGKEPADIIFCEYNPGPWLL